jgi:hypothetical protein
MGGFLMGNWFITFSVKWYNGITKVLEDDHGILCANSFAEAARYLEEYYGEDLDSITRLEFVEEASLLLTKDIIDSIFEHIEENN